MIFLMNTFYDFFKSCTNGKLFHIWTANWNCKISVNFCQKNYENNQAAVKYFPPNIKEMEENMTMFLFLFYKKIKVTYDENALYKDLTLLKKQILHFFII